MLYGYLEQSVQDLQTLIQLTSQDLEDIKEANHEAVFARNGLKKERIASFENCKALFDQEMLVLMEKNPGTPLVNLLDERGSVLLKEMRQLLTELKEINADYARIVFAVSDFYSKLMQQIVPYESTGYYNQKTVASSFLQVRA
ncbi:hypothetical protein [Helicobacter heilmannii]|uniref:Uncharacterized protein n=1 Tax=Helicobacter heilmannii TaxID=35817 RepID=A0A0K2Y7U7_HELHE|nr:hypothetical protein [Helicobacter heilmannii]BDQ27921.1 hypothetical protein ASB1_15970 [Helicobacter heilmannii]CCM10730.1 hypothetical protein BN341_16650 [Helicobacter heilmannii ASB1.4]CRI35236.1 hypothetical protein HHE01_02340 [Helicobacter heilmannii]